MSPLHVDTRYSSSTCYTFTHSLYRDSYATRSIVRRLSGKPRLVKRLLLEMFVEFSGDDFSIELRQRDTSLLWGIRRSACFSAECELPAIVSSSIRISVNDGLSAGMGSQHLPIKERRPGCLIDESVGRSPPSATFSRKASTLRRCENGVFKVQIS